MSDELTVRIAEVLGAHGECQWNARKGGKALMTCGAPLPAVYGVRFPYAHMAEQVRAVLGETTTEWGVRWIDRPERGTPSWSEEGSRAYVTVDDTATLVSRTVTPWIEVPS